MPLNLQPLVFQHLFSLKSMQEPTVNNEKAYKVFRGSLLSDLIQHDGVEDAPEASKPGPADDWSWWISNRVDSQGKKADDFARYCEEIIRVGKIALEVFLPLI